MLIRVLVLSRSTSSFKALIFRRRTTSAFKAAACNVLYLMMALGLSVRVRVWNDIYSFMVFEGSTAPDSGVFHFFPSKIQFYSSVLSCNVDIPISNVRPGLPNLVPSRVRMPLPCRRVLYSWCVRVHLILHTLASMSYRVCHNALWIRRNPPLGHNFKIKFKYEATYV